MVHYKLTYFAIRGAGECARQIFALADQEFEDVRLDKEQFAKVKPDLPFGQVPVLEVDGKQLAQSLAICRYLARQFGFAGKSTFDEAVVDSLADQYSDYRVEIKSFFYTVIGMREGDVEQLKKEVLLPARDKFFGFITKFLKKSPSGFLVGDSLTWVDLLVSEHNATMLTFVPEFLEGYPEVRDSLIEPCKRAHGKDTSDSETEEMDRNPTRDIVLICSDVILLVLIYLSYLHCQQKFIIGLQQRSFFTSAGVKMVQYKLIYFDGRGRAECARQIFALAGHQYDDVRLTPEKFAEIKPKLPFGQVPVLEVDGKQLAQSFAIARFLARQWGLSGSNAFDEAVVDSLADQYADYCVEVKPYVYTLLGFMNAGDLEQLKKDVMMPGRDKFLRFITKFLKKSKSGFLVGEKVTWVDLLISEHVADMSSRMPEYLDGFPEVPNSSGNLVFLDFFWCRDFDFR
ncbi:glutathione S-transferase protein [Necator americanus]|uniref:glutathione transferase n=1 Tax=Necator americanus TaxID=51031 RepID=W2TIC9_NECAM|nr:glutathione S-transferase protein [Necator americanus]ETN80926.1 glutathione S-transferase protein [Necator americanus]